MPAYGPPKIFFRTTNYARTLALDVRLDTRGSRFSQTPDELRDNGHEALLFRLAVPSITVSPVERDHTTAFESRTTSGPVR